MADKYYKIVTKTGEEAKDLIPTLRTGMPMGMKGVWEAFQHLRQFDFGGDEEREMFDEPGEENQVNKFKFPDEYLEKIYVMMISFKDTSVTLYRRVDLPEILLA